MLNIIPKPSSHFRKPRKAPIDTLVLHYISAVNITPDDPFNVEECLKFLREPIVYTVAGKQKSVRVSAHYLIDRAGDIYQLVDDENVAWHAGKSSLRGRSIRNSCNDFSIGIELVGGAFAEFTDEQYESLIELVRDKILVSNPIPKENMVGHEHIAPGRKTDPGKQFDWERFFKGVFPEPVQESGLEDLVKFDKEEMDKEIEKVRSGNVEKTSDITDGRDEIFVKKLLGTIRNIFPFS